MRVEHVDGFGAALKPVAKAHVRANARLLQAPDGVQPAMRDVVGLLGVVVVDREVRVGKEWIGQAQGLSKKAAGQKAAESILQQLTEWGR